MSGLSGAVRPIWALTQRPIMASDQGIAQDYPELIQRDTALSMVLARRTEQLALTDTESVSIDTVDGRTAAEEIIADKDSPEYSYATMDGFAFDATDGYPLRLLETDVFPEDEPPVIASGEAVPIATGAPLPEGANAVLKQEDATIEDDQLQGPDIASGTYAYERGSNVAAGESLITENERLSPKDAILLRDIGRESVDVHRVFSVGVLATGTEIHENRSKDLDSPMLAGLVRSWGHSATYAGSVPDEYEEVRDRIASLADQHDVVITTGGTSVGKKDYAVRALAELGTIEFHGVRIRPGKPIALASLEEPEATAFAIPGKPIGAHTITTLIARPFFTGNTQLPSTPATLTHDVGVPAADFEYAVPVTMDGQDAMPLGHEASPLRVYSETFDPSVLSSSTRASRANGLVLTKNGLAAGASVEVIPYPVIE